MGKYALGNPKNTWTDCYDAVKPGAFVAVYWQDRDEDDLVVRETKQITVYEVIQKRIMFNDSMGVEWVMRELATNTTHQRMLMNLCWDRHEAYMVAITKEQADAFLADPATELPLPRKNPVPPYKDYAYAFDTQGGKYPRPAKAHPYKEPAAGSRWRFWEPMRVSYYDVTVEGIELWGVGNPRAVAYKRDGSDTLERRTVEYFKHNFNLMR